MEIEQDAGHAAREEGGRFRVGIRRLVDAEGVKMRGTATMTIGDAAVAFERRIGLLPFAKTTVTSVLDRENIWDVVRGEKTIYFDHQVAGRAHKCAIVAGSVAAADAILRALPVQKTAEFEEERRSHHSYWKSLAAATPRVWVVDTIVAINVLVYVAMGLGGVNWMSPRIEDMLRWGADSWALTTGGQWWRLLTAAFLHFGLLHLGLNMWALRSVGSLTERLYGNKSFGLLYLFGAIVSSLASTWWDRGAVSAGASGAIFAVYGGLLAYLVMHREALPRSAYQRTFNSTVIFIAYNVFFGLTQVGISNSAHLGGLVSGFGIGLLLARPLEPQRRASQTRRRAALATVVGIAVIAAGLATIPKSGYDPVSEAAFEKAKAEARLSAHDGYAEYNAIVKSMQAGKTTGAQAAAEIREKVLPRFDGIVTALRVVAVHPSSPTRVLQELLVRFFALRLEAFWLVADAIENDDEAKAKKSDALLKEADGLEAQIRAAEERGF
jgi:rhomboid protease GluP